MSDEYTTATAKNPRYPGAYTSDQPSPFEKSEFANDPKVQEWNAESAEKGFFNQRDPHYAIKHEQPIHRAAVLLKAAGRTNKEIAAQLDMSAVSVSNILRQPWAVKLLLDEVQKAGREEIVAMFEAAKGEVAENLLAMATGTKEGVPAAVQKAACDSVIDRLLGKAVQPISKSYSDNDLQKLSDSDLLKLASNGTN